MRTIQIYDAKQNAVVSLEKIEKSDAEWKKLLTKKQYEITTRKGTEAPGSCPFDEIHEPGIFSVCAVAPTFFGVPQSSNRGQAGPAFMSQSRR